MIDKVHNSASSLANGRKACGGERRVLSMSGDGAEGQTRLMHGCRQAVAGNATADLGGMPAGVSIDGPQLSATISTEVLSTVMRRARQERAIRSGAHPRWMHASSLVHAGSMDDEDRGVGERQEGTDGIAEDEVPPMVECVHADMCQEDESAHIIACSPDTEEEQNSQTEATRNLYTPMGHRGTRQTIGSHESVMGSVEPWGKAAGTFEGKALDPRRRVIRGEVRGGTLCHVAVPGWSLENSATNSADAAWKPLQGLPAARRAGYSLASFVNDAAASFTSHQRSFTWRGTTNVRRWATVAHHHAPRFYNQSPRCRCGTYPR